MKPEEIEKRLEMVAAYIIEDGTQETTSGNYCHDPDDIPGKLLPSELIKQHQNEIVELLESYGAVMDVEIDESGAFDVCYGLAYCPNYEPWESELDEYPPDRKIETPFETESQKAALSQMNIELYGYPPVYMESLVHARENNQLDTFIQSRELNQACSAYMDKAIHDSNYEPNRYNMEAAAKDVIGKYGMERTKIILANSVQKKDYDGRFSRDNKDWAKGVALPNVHEHARHDFFTDTHPVLLDGFINRVRQIERTAQKTTEQKPSLLGQLKENRQTAPTDKPAGKTKHQEMEV